MCEYMKHLKLKVKWKWKMNVHKVSCNWKTRLNKATLSSPGLAAYKQLSQGQNESKSWRATPGKCPNHRRSVAAIYLESVNCLKNKICY